LDAFDKKVEKANNNKDAYLRRRNGKASARLNFKVEEIYEQSQQIKEKRSLDMMG